MSTRYNSKSISRFGVPGIANKTHQGTPEFSIPPVGIEDADTALFNLFEKEMSLKVSADNSEPKKVPVIFAAGEKWALLKKRRALRDKNGSLILPLITIVRNSISQDAGEDIAGRGINQQTGEIVIQRRLDKSDRNFQNLINRFLLKNQKNVATNPSKEHLPDQLLTLRAVGEDADDPTIADGAWLADIKTKNIYETIVIPSPQFCKLSYDISLWTQYTQHMNQLLEQIVSSFLPQANTWKLETSKGYWFLATVDGNSYEPENNFEDMSQEERMIKYKFSVTVRAYIFAGSSPGVNIPVKRYVSSPIITFETNVDDFGLNTSKGNTENPFLGSDDPTLPLAEGKVLRRDQRRAGTRLYTEKEDNLASDDPALATRAAQQNKPLYSKLITKDSSGAPSTRYARVYRVTSAQGETVIKPANDLTSKSSPASVDALLGGVVYDSADDL
jgi:hypothetical protein